MDDERLEALLDLDQPEPSDDFDERFWGRWSAGEREEEAEDLVEVEPGPSLGDARTVEQLDHLLDQDQPEPSGGFDERFWHRWSQADVEGEVEDLVDADRPEPSPGFDARAAERLSAVTGSGRPERLRQPPRPQPRRRRRRWWGAAAATLAAGALAAAMLLSVGADAPLPEAPQQLAMLANLELLEDYGPIEVLDALEDPETFELVAMLDELEKEETL